jgi:hypothetical protein
MAFFDSPANRDGLFRASPCLPSRCLLQMDTPDREKKRRQYRWSKDARQLVKTYENGHQLAPDQATREARLKVIVSKLVALTGNPRRACWYFVRQLGITTKQEYRKWTVPEQQRLLDLMALNPLQEVGRIMRRSERSLRSKLHKLGASSQMGHDWFTKYTLAEALHVRADLVQRWLDFGWLKARIIETGGLKKEIIDADAFAEFCKQHRAAVVGRRLHVERLDFIQNFVFPPSHAALLPVRERGYKKRNPDSEARDDGNRGNRREEVACQAQDEVGTDEPDLSERADGVRTNVA